MKNLLTVILLFIGSMASAQVVNIPDPVFKNWLVSNAAINTNGDTEIQLSEALTVTSITISYNSSGPNIADFTGIRSFANLTWFELFNLNDITTLDFSGLALLKNIWIHTAENLTSINTTGCTNIERLDLEHTNLSSLNVAHLQKLVTLQMQEDPHVTELIAENCSKLKTVNLDATFIDYINLKNCDSLNNFIGDMITSKKVDLTGCDALTSIDLTPWVMDTLILKNCSKLTTVTSRGFMLAPAKMIDFTGLTRLNSLTLTGIFLRNVDLSTCINLRELRWTREGNSFTNINLKNGSALTVLNIPANGNHDTVYVCTDDFETAAVTASLGAFITGGGLVNVNSYCSFTGGGNYNTINGKVRLDMNNNGCDAGDAGMGYVPISFLNSTTGETFTNSTYTTGDYAFYTYKGNFTLTPMFPNPYFTTSPATANVVFDTANNLVDTRNFCIAPNGNHNDLEISFYPASASPRPGMSVDYWLVYKNKGTTTLSGNVQVNYDNSRMNLSPLTITVSSQSPGQLVWNYTNLQPFQSVTELVTFDLLPPPANNIHDSITFTGTVNPVVGDETPADNGFAMVQEVRGSWDPNDIQCLEGAKISPFSLSSPLHYLIRFQNTGTDTAFNVVVMDTLSNKYDWNSFEFIRSSHPCAVKRKGNKLEFMFANIKLPHQAIDDAGSHGYIVFRIKPKNTLMIGDSLNNKAAIFFDFNLPVITNKVATVVSNTSTLDLKLEYFTLRSQEQRNLLTWKATSTSGNSIFEIERSADGIQFSSVGSITATVERCQSPFNYADERPYSGKNYYRIKMTDADGITSYSKTLVAGKSSQGLDIISMINTPQQITLNVSSSKQQVIHLKLIAADGKVMYKSSRSVLVGTSQLSISMQQVARGITTLMMYTNEGEMISKRFIK